MSSHHFVKEGQEPALLILSTTAISFDKVQELLEWSPTLVVAEEQLESVLAWGIKIDAILCTQPNIFIIDEKLKDQFPLQFIPYQSSDNKLKRAVEYLVEKKCTDINLLTNSTKDFIEAQNYQQISIEVFFNNQKWTWITNRPFQKWLTEGTLLSIFPTEVQVFTTGLSKALICYQDGMVQIGSKKKFWVGEQV